MEAHGGKGGIALTGNEIISNCLKFTVGLILGGGCAVSTPISELCSGGNIQEIKWTYEF
jgi:hypothetical protein